MTPEHVAATCIKYDGVLAEMGFRVVKNPFSEFKEGRLCHLRWMFAETVGFLEQHVANGGTDKLEKAMRWLGFVQGVLMCYDVMTVEQMKEDNR